MPLIPGLTRPENFAERGERRRIVAKVTAAGGCAYCLNRDTSVLAWGRSVCTKTGRAFPLCLHDKAKPAFELDEQQLKGSK